MGLRKVVRDSFIAGLALVAPLIVTIVALQFLVGWLTTFIDPLVEETRLAQYTANIHIVAQVLAFLIVLIVIVVLGYLAQRSFGRKLFDWIDRGFSILPLVNVIYLSVRQVSNALMEGSNRYESVVLVEYPRRGLYTIGFVTANGPTQIEQIAGEEVYNVFLPNSPNPTAGRLVHVPAEQLQEIDVSVRQGIRLLVTMGIAEGHSEVEKLKRETL